MRHLDLSVRFATPTDAGVIEGHAAVWDERNDHKELIQRGAFTNSLAEHKVAGSRPLMLWSHDPAEPIGVWESVTEDDTGLAVRGRLITETRRGAEALALLKAGALDGLSIGFIPVRQKRAKGGLLLTEINLKEISLVALPSAAGARIKSIRNQHGRTKQSAVALVNVCRKASRSLTKQDV